MDFMNSEYGQQLTLGPVPSILATNANLDIARKITVMQNDLEKLFDVKSEEPVLFSSDATFSTVKTVSSPPPTISVPEPE